ncbi:uncharacterized protein LOC142541872 [Primulina tabacum]|uniref:uncharacterized protein LOC142541872 n=1 Tax=Primulina tabacum TaxID=48773 RepID=UPI003F5A73E5
MDLGFRVLISSGDQMFTSQIGKKLELRLQKNAVQEDLIALSLPEFDIILGMDWLSSNGSVIDFRRRKVTRRGCQAFLDSIVSVIEPVSQRLEEVEVVRDFLIVSPYDVSGIPPYREVNFSI